MRNILCLALLLAACRSAAAPAAEETPSIAERTAALRAVPGFVPLWCDERRGRVLAELPAESEEFLYVVSLPHGLGSNDVGLDRGQLGDQRLVRAVRAGERVLLVAPNQVWRASSEEPAVRAATRESFAESVLFGFPVVARDGERVLVDATEFFLRDAHRVARKLGAAGQGEFELDPARSVLAPGGALGFPANTSVDALLTFTGTEPGPELVATAPDPHALTLRVRHTFARLPSEPWRTRAFHPRSGFFPLELRDTTAPLDEPTRVNLVTRHRLEKVHPERAASPVVEPIVYYVDRGAPEPVRTALLEGARYWEPVFEAAGFEGGFRAELLPEGADVHDLRYHVIEWVQRSTRGWSYGDSVVDPRTGEILAGRVTLGALRVRQDVLLAEGLLSPYATGADGESERAVEMALARIRQLAAHEVGHTLGLAHAFGASAAGRASVMDYPAPLVTIDAAGELELSDAYRAGCGDWDELALRYGYADFAHLGLATPAECEQAGLARVLADMDAGGHVFLGDEDARGADRLHPLANLWDNGDDPLEQLELELEVRRIALARFSEAALRMGRPLAELEEVLVPVVLHHRYQLEAALRTLGGMSYRHALRGEESRLAPVDVARQERALELALATLERDFLELPAPLRQLVPPRPSGSPPNREQLAPGAQLFDPVAAAAATADLTLEQLLDPGRAVRLVDQARRDPALPSFELVLERLIARLFREPAGFEGGEGPSIRTELRHLVVRRLMSLTADAAAPARVREPSYAALHAIAELSGPGSLLGDLLARFFEDPAAAGELAPLRAIPGPPIGCTD